MKAPARQRQSFGARVLAHDVHEGGDGELGKVAEEREQPIVFLGIDDARNGVEAGTNAVSESMRGVGRRTGFASAATGGR